MIVNRALRPVSYLVVFAIIFTLFGFRVAHPKSGLRSAAGDASTSIVAFKHSNSYKVGDKVVIRLDEKAKSPAIGIVRTTDQQAVVIQVGDIAIPTTSQKILGKLIGVFPFIGIIFNLVGK